MSLRLVIALAIVAFAGPAPEYRGDPPAEKPVVTFRLGYEAPHWHVTVEGKGLNPTGKRVALELADFGSWTDLADYYIPRLTATPPATPDPTNPARWIIQPPDGWDGTLRAEYSLHAAREGTAAQRSHARQLHSLKWVSDNPE